MKILNIIRNLLEFFRINKKIKISFKDFTFLKSFSQRYNSDSKIKINGFDIKFSSPFWFLHSINEIFVDEVYRFKPSNEKVKILDCGANVGLSILYLKKIFPNAHIVGFEPDAKVFSQLEHNIKSFGLIDVDLENSAVWVNNEKLIFNSDGGVGGKLSEGNDNFENKIEVNAIRLRDYLNEKIFFLKIDIEGAEYIVLKDILDALQNVENLFIEFHSEKNKKNQLAEILRWIEEAGFEYYIKDAWDNMLYPFTKVNTGGFHMQLNIFCFRIHENE